MPRLNLAFARSHFAGPARRPAAAPAAASPTESSASTASCGAEAQPSLAQGEQPGKPPQARSPPRLVLNCGLYEHSAAKPGLTGSRLAGSPGAALSEGPSGRSVEPPASEQECSVDLFSRPAAHDPLLEEDAAAGRPAPVPAPAPAALTSQPAADSPVPAAAASPASGSASASGACTSDSGADCATAAAALDLLRRGAAMLGGLGSGALDTSARAELASLAAQLKQHAVAPAAGAKLVVPTEVRCAAAAPGSGGGRENARLNEGPAAHAADLASMKREILSELRAELLQELRASQP